LHNIIFLLKLFTQCLNIIFKKAFIMYIFNAVWVLAIYLKSL
jgi:hypothetical protein